MDAIVFTLSGSFREQFEERQAEVDMLIAFVHDRFCMAVGVLSEGERETVEEEMAALDLDFAVGNVENLVDELTTLTRRYDAVFFVSDVRAELANANQTGAFTIGYNSAARTAEELGGVGPNYIVDDLDELQQILALEHMPE